MNNPSSQHIRVALFFIVGAALIWIVHDKLNNSALIDRTGYTLQAAFPDLRQLKSGDEVRMSGVKVGNVRQTKLDEKDGTRAIAILQIEANISIPQDSIATISTAGLLGNNYVGIVCGKGPEKLKDKDPIKTKESADINTLITKLGDISDRIDGALKGLDGLLGGAKDKEGPGALFQNLNQLVVENRDKLSKALSNFEKISTGLAEGRGTLGKLISDEGAYTHLMGTATDIRTAAKDVSKMASEADGIVAKFGTIVDDVKAGKGTLGALPYDEGTATAFRSSMANINEFTQKLNSGTSTLGRLITSDDLYKEAQGTLKKVNNAVDSLNDSGPITAVGVAAQTLF